MSTCRPRNDDSKNSDHIVREVEMSLEAYRRSRDMLLRWIATELSKDDRFIAAWLAGSLSRNDADFLSDIDLRLVIADQYSPILCNRLEQVSAQTSPERYTLFSQFGTPALIHENNNNAPDGGTFTFVLYADSAVMIDWVLVPQLSARRPLQSRLLFEKAAIPVEPAPQSEDLKQSKKYVAEQWAFFWMMTAITIKYIFREDGVFATEWIEQLHWMIHEIERRMNREPWSYHRSSLSKLQVTRESQMESIRELCGRMLELKPKVSDFISSEPLDPIAEIEELLALAHNSNPNDQSQITDHKS